MLQETLHQGLEARSEEAHLQQQIPSQNQTQYIDGSSQELQDTVGGDGKPNGEG